MNIWTAMGLAALGVMAFIAATVLLVSLVSAYHAVKQIQRTRRGLVPGQRYCCMECREWNVHPEDARIGLCGTRIGRWRPWNDVCSKWEKKR